jgi:cytochrome c biogenesis protein CcmG, thiol:disulfide interchange protein DsbE
MKTVVLTILFTAIFIAKNYAQSELPDTKIKTLAGKQIAFNNIPAIASDTAVIISFWATWCIPCINELNTINEQYEDRQKQTPFKLLAISVDDARTAPKVRSVVAGKGWPYDIFLDTNSDLKRAFNVNEIPYVMVIKGGKIIYQHTGYMAGNEEELFEAVKSN